MALAAVLCAGEAAATDVALTGLLGGKALLVVDGGAPRAVAVGKSTPEGVTLVAIVGDTATVDFDGRRYKLRLGGRLAKAGGASGGGARDGSGMSGEQARKILARGVEIDLEANDHGQFIVGGEINGDSVRFLVDTGASAVSLGRADAHRLRLDVDRPPDGASQTANGVAKFWRVPLKWLKVGSLRFENVDAVVMENDMPYVLLGMNVLGRMEMRRDGARMKLRKKP